MSSERWRWALGLAALVGVASNAAGGVLLAKDEAFEAAFGAEATVRSRTVFLDDAQMAMLTERAGSPPASPMFTYYVAERAGELLGYGVIETHTVRTLPEAFLAVLTPTGRVERVLLLAFYEPPEYQPADRWLAQFQGRSADDGWRLGRDIHGISGATLTARAVTDALRRLPVLHELVMAPGSP